MQEGLCECEHMLKTNPKKFWHVIDPQDNDVIVLNDLGGDAVPTD